MALKRNYGPFVFSERFLSFLLSDNFERELYTYTSLIIVSKRETNRVVCFKVILLYYYIIIGVILKTES